mmetsp:Transcript_62217/g.180421  ORF Transcript_62217/g.180421 Transcript_62217/m.180421 type:complete len:207 (+) Transcript_62217:589-1209(+)
MPRLEAAVSRHRSRELQRSDRHSREFHRKDSCGFLSSLSHPRDVLLAPRCLRRVPRARELRVEPTVLLAAAPGPLPLGADGDAARWLDGRLDFYVVLIPRRPPRSLGHVSVRHGDQHVGPRRDCVPGRRQLRSALHPPKLGDLAAHWPPGACGHRAPHAAGAGAVLGASARGAGPGHVRRRLHQRGEEEVVGEVVEVVLALPGDRQ